MLEVGQTVKGKTILKVKELPNKKDGHLKLVFCKFRNQYVSYLYNVDFESFNYGRYSDDYEQGVIKFKDHCQYYNIECKEE